MRCLLVADVHYDLHKFDWISQAAEHVDLVVIAGDHLELASTVARAAQAVVAEKYFREIRSKVRLLVSSGNHDLDGDDENGELAARWIRKARYFDVPTDGDSVTIDDTLFTLCPWWEGPGGRAAIDAQLQRDAARRPRHWVWVYHGPPEDSPTSWDGKRSYGDQALRDWIARHEPDMVMAGHVHQAPFKPDGSWIDRIGGTWVFNAGHQFGPVPAHVLVDWDEPRAWWLSAAGAQTVALDAPLERPPPPLREGPDWLAAIARLGFD